MRKRTLEYLIRNTIREEMNEQSIEIVEYELYTMLDNSYHIDTDAVEIERSVSSCSFELYISYNNVTVELAHYHTEDLMWIVTHLDEVRKSLHKNIERFIKYCSANVEVNERY